MIQRLSLYLFCLLYLLACTPEPQVTPEEKALSDISHQLILPWHQEFVASTTELAQSLERFCQNPGNPGELEASRSSWRAAMLSWQTLRPINFGPVQENNQAWRIQFWPDTHNRVGQKVEALLAQETPITADSLASANVLVQGLSALEYLLFDPDKTDPATLQPPRVCEYLRAAGANTQSVAAGLADGWAMGQGNFVGTFLSAGPGNQAFPTQKDAVAALVSGVVSSLEVIKNRKLGDAFGGRPGSGRINPYHLELWRSRLSLEAMQRELDANRQLYQTGLRPLLLAGGHKTLAQQLDDTFSRAGKTLASLPHPLETQIQEPSALPQFQAAFDQLGQLLALLKRDLPAAMGLQLGFNANDGD
jgi:predicted lipoprotein